MNRMSKINKTSNCFNDMLPMVDLPFVGESLIGYLFRLAYINDFAPASIFKEIIDPEILSKFIKLGDIEFLELNLDITKLSLMTQIPVEIFQNLMICKIRKRVYKYNCSKTKKALSYTELKICSICIKEWRIPSIFLLYGVEKCPRHGIPLINRCKCGKKINFFKQSNVLVCSNRKCNMKITDIFDYATLPNSNSKNNKYTIMNEYINYGVPFVREDEKVFKGIVKRLTYLSRFYKEAVKYFRITFPFCRYKNINAIFDNPKHGISFSDIIYCLNKFKLTPYQFQNLYIPNNPSFTVELKSIGLSMNNNQIKVDSPLNFSHICKTLLDNLEEIEVVGQIEVSSEKIEVDFEFRIFDPYNNPISRFVID